MKITSRDVATVGHRPAKRSLSRRTALKGLGAAGVASMVTPVQLRGAWAQEASPAAADLDAYPAIEVIAREFSFELPAEVEGGLTRITLVNEGQLGHHAIFLRLDEGLPQDEIDAAVADPDFFRLLGSGELLGGPNNANPGGGTSTVIVDLAPGNYLVVCVIPDDEGIPHYLHGMYAPLTVTESASALEAPAADLTVELVDFAFNHLPHEVPPGQQIWEVVNVGQEPHELALMKVNEGVPVEVVLGIFSGGPPPSPAGDGSHEMGAATPRAAMAASPEAAGPPPGPPPFAGAGGIAPLSPDVTNWAVLDLEPGTYIAICFVPSPEMGGAPHFALGMIMPFTVAEGQPE